MFRSVFRPYGPVWTFCNHLTDALALSILWCACCLPVFTIGAATTALYDAAVHGMRYHEPGLYRRFFRTLRNELKTGTLVTVLWGMILLFGIYVLSLLKLAGAEDTRAAIAAGAYQALMLVPLAVACWCCAILSRFTYGFRALTAVSLRFLFAHFLPSAAISVLTFAAAWFCSENPIALTFLPAVTVIGWSLFAEPVFKKYGGEIKPESMEE